MNRWKNYYEQMKEATVILLLNWEPVIPHYNNIKLKDVSDRSEFWLHAVSDHEATITIPFLHFPVRTSKRTRSLFVFLLFTHSHCLSCYSSPTQSLFCIFITSRSCYQFHKYKSYQGNIIQPTPVSKPMPASIESYSYWV
jgi:hypothetical protein